IPLVMSDIVAGSTPKSIIFETFPSLVDLRLSPVERQQKQRRMEEKYLVERKEEKGIKGFTKILSSASAVKQNPSLPLPDFASELSPKQIVDALNNGGFSNTRRRVELMVEDRLLKLFEEEKLVSSALLKEMNSLAARREAPTNEEKTDDKSSSNSPHGLVEPTPLTAEDFDAMKNIPIERREHRREEGNSVEVDIESRDDSDAVVTMERGAVLSDPIELHQGFNETSRLFAEQVVDSLLPANGTNSILNDEEGGRLDEQATARNVANIMARLLREIIESSKRENTETVAPPAPPSSESTTSTTSSSFLTTGLDDVVTDLTTTSSSTKNRTEEVSTSEEMQEILITDVDGAKVLSATIQHTNGLETTSASREISITVTSVPLSIATTPPTEISINATGIPHESEAEQVVTTTSTTSTTTTSKVTTTETATTQATPISTSPFPTLIPQGTAETAPKKEFFTTRQFNPKVCEDNHSLCNVWSKYGECVKNPGYMYKYCRQSCGICSLRKKL
ncbi:hypothetical protein PRIPAC_90298, partial [Pristionchus pacificus]